MHARPIVLPLRLTGATREIGAPPSSPAPASPPALSQPDPAVQIARESETLRRLFGNLETAAGRLVKQQALPLDELQQVAVELGLAFACRLTCAKIEAGEFGMEELVRGAIQRLRPRAGITLFLHPDDLALLQQRHGDDLAAIAPDTKIEVRGDAQLGRGDCRAAAGELAVWSDLQKRLWDLRDQLLEGLALDSRGAA